MSAKAILCIQFGLILLLANSQATQMKAKQVQTAPATPTDQNEIIAHSLDLVLQPVRNLFYSLADCSANLELETDSSKGIHSLLLHCLNAAIDKLPKERIRSISSRDLNGKIRFWATYEALIETRCLKLDRLATLHSKYLESTSAKHLPKESRDLLRYRDMCWFIDEQDVDIKKLYGMFLRDHDVDDDIDAAIDADDD